jgi:hypothetical protein
MNRGRGLIGAGLALLLAQPASAAAPVGIYLLDEHASPTLDQAATGPYDGMTVQVRWSDLQPEPTRFDWSSLDGPLTTALRLGRKISVGIQAGQWTPEWLFAAPYRVGYDHVTFSWGRGNKCTQADIPRPWDPALVSNMVLTWRQVAAHLARMPGAMAALTMVKVNGFNLANDQLRALTSPPRSAERGGCEATDGTALYRQEGFRPSAVLSNWVALARGINAAFPTTAMSIDVISGPGVWPAIDDNGTVYDARDGGAPDLTARIVGAAVSLFPGRIFVQANTLDMGPIPEPIMGYVALGARLGLQTNAHTRGGASCGVKGQQEACTPEGFAALLEHGMQLGGWFIEVHPNDAVAYPQVLQSAGARLRAAHRAG